MRERPIIFNAEMVRAILGGRKTQTRRVIKSQPWPDVFSYIGVGVTGLWCGYYVDPDIPVWEANCPYGKPGDQLWVRETWATPGNWDEYKPSDLLDNWFNTQQVKYRATEPYPDGGYYKWRPSIFMPRWASRIQLEVESVRIEKVQDITPEDCAAEGCQHWTVDGIVHKSARKYFKKLWDSINKKRGFGWDVNPWVWMIHFKVIEVKNGY